MLCSWSASRLSRHPAFSFLAVGAHANELVHEHSLLDPLRPVEKMLAYDPHVLMVKCEFDAVTLIHLAEERKTISKFAKERASTITSRGREWVEVLGIGCSNGFNKINSYHSRDLSVETTIEFARAQLHPMKMLVD
jgi:aminoglycoside N3'-acetyltransferase